VRDAGKGRWREGVGRWEQMEGWRGRWRYRRG
jgi:hypothetical protein